MVNTRFWAITVVTLVALFAGCVSKPTCNSPYILVGTDCCLDRNANRICDTDDTTTTIPTTTTTRKTTTTTTTSTTTTTTTTTTTSTTTTLKLPVTDADFEEHISSGEEYTALQRGYGKANVLMRTGSDSFEETLTLLTDMVEREHFSGCLNCFNFSGGTVWVSEFGAKNAPDSYACLIDKETGTGAMYHHTTNDVTCRCDTI
jgi:hypothetical protein